MSEQYEQMSEQMSELRSGFLDFLDRIGWLMQYGNGAAKSLNEKENIAWLKS